MPTPMDAYAYSPRNASAAVTAATTRAFRIENSVNRTGRLQRNEWKAWQRNLNRATVVAYCELVRSHLLSVMAWILLGGGAAVGLLAGMGRPILRLLLPLAGGPAVNLPPPAAE